PSFGGNVGISFGSGSSQTSTSTSTFGARNTGFQTTGFGTTGISAAPANTGSFMGNSLGSSASSATAPQSQTPKISGNIKISELPQQTKQQLINLQNYIHQQKNISEQLEQYSSTKKEKLAEEIENLSEV